MKQTTIPGTEARVARPRIISDEQLRQASRAHRKAKAAAWSERHPWLQAESNERDARRLASRVEKGHTVDTEKVKAQLADREREYLQCRRDIEAMQQNIQTATLSARRLEGAMLALRVALGDEAPPVPPELQPAGAPAPEAPTGTVQ